MGPLHPRQNRVTPEGVLIAAPWRGDFMGNRGILHDATGQLGVARWRHPHWVTCTLNCRPHRAPHPINAPGRYTPLFFADEAVASAAGHRPCCECRREVWRDFAAAWADAFGEKPTAPAVDRVLHAARVTRKREPIWHEARPEALPAGVFFRRLAGSASYLRTPNGAKPFDVLTGGYGAETALPLGMVTVLTPAPLVAVMAAGWQPCLSREADRPGWAHHAP